MKNSALDTTLKQLRLSGLGQSLPARLQEAAANQISHAEFLELILQDELNIRHQRDLERRTHAADFRHPKKLEDFDWSFNPGIPRKLTRLSALAPIFLWKLRIHWKNRVPPILGLLQARFSYIV